jgi:hypothetical protein
MKEYHHEKGYVRESVLIFTDPELKEENFHVMKSRLCGYVGSHGEVIHVDILKNEVGSGAIIRVVIVCFKSLLRLLEVDELDYSNFILNHLIRFEKFYMSLDVSK